MAEDIEVKDAYAAIVLIRSDARNTRPPITQAYTDQVLYVMTDTEDDFKGKNNPE